MKFALLLKGLG